MQVTFDRLSMYEIANLKLSTYDQLMCIDSIDHVGFTFPTLRRARAADPTEIKHTVWKTDKDVCVPAHKIIIKDLTKLQSSNVNSTDLMKNVSIKCRSLSNFLMLY